MTLLYKCYFYFILNGNNKTDNCQKFKKRQEQMIAKDKNSSSHSLSLFKFVSIVLN